MTSVVLHAPRFSRDDAIRIAREVFGFSGHAEALPSERDQNFKVSGEGGAVGVLKIANGTETRDVLEMQNAVLSHISDRAGRFSTDGPPAPVVLSATDGAGIATISAPDGTSHWVRMLSFVAGTPLARVRPHDNGFLESLGRFFGTLDAVLADFDHPAARRDFHWDLRHAGREVGRLSSLIEDGAKRKRIEGYLERYRKRIEPVLGDLPIGVIHGDGNDYNVLAAPHGDWGLRVSGVIDFGDIVHSQVINELAIVCAYAMMGKSDPVAAAGRVVAGYHAVLPLDEAAFDVLFDLIVMRLCTSVCKAAEQCRIHPENAYLGISETPAWELLERIETEHSRLSGYRFRDACGLAPVPRAVAVVDWLTAQGAHAASVVDADLAAAGARVLDLSVGSPDFDARMAVDPAIMAEAVLRDPSPGEIGIGRYDEARLCYLSDAYAVPGAELPERRTVHLGIDIFMPAGTAVHAPLAGTVHGFRDNADAYDYGPTILLKHETDSGEVFHTLYGHLSRESLDGLTQGQSIAKGQRIAWLGESTVNGGWAPHLHFQILVDTLDQTENFPGVARPSQRRVWTALCPDPNLLLRIPEEKFPSAERGPEVLREARSQRLGKNLSISYSRPLKIVRGIGPYLYTHDGIPYLDGVNNVCHVGHCHPRVVAAGQRQSAVLNTNTRYLHDHIVDYAEKLLATFPEPLSVCYFVCSGSEANELALRMARTATGRRDIITVDGAYHGNTQGLIDISPYKHNGPGGFGPPPWVHTATMPCGFRGPYKGTGEETGRKYAESVREAVEKSIATGDGPAAFICESMLGCGGQIVLPDGYLAAAFAHVRKAGGVCIADEVQVGFGRAGSHFWAFETQGVVPDIVTLGKPMGNGHPIAAVITTPAIAEAFANGMEYFNTYGGNPVSCAIGMAVLDVIRDEGLQENARDVGDYLLAGLSELKKKYPLVADVRGKGLYIGAELVTDRETLTPAGGHAGYIADRMKDFGILMSTDGPFHNVLKIKPPIIFSRAHADRMVSVLDRILSEDRLQL